jgi:hypothetical protein
MTTPKPTAENQDLSEDSSESSSSSAAVTGFFQRVRRGLEPELEEKPVHPSEAAEIVIMGPAEIVIMGEESESEREEG